MGIHVHDNLLLVLRVPHRLNSYTKMISSIETSSSASRDGNASPSSPQLVGSLDTSHNAILGGLGTAEAEDNSGVTPARRKAKINDHSFLVESDDDPIPTLRPGLEFKSVMKGPMSSGQPDSAAPSPDLYVCALYDYEADDKTQISFCQGDIIQVIAKHDSGWWDGIALGADGRDGENRGERGWFPSNHCTLDTSRTQNASVGRTCSAIITAEVIPRGTNIRLTIRLIPPYVFARFDYKASTEEELSFRRGDVIQVIDWQDSEWWDGMSNGIFGWFPSSYCTEDISLALGSNEAQGEPRSAGTTNASVSKSKGNTGREIDVRPSPKAQKTTITACLSEQ